MIKRKKNLYVHLTSFYPRMMSENNLQFRKKHCTPGNS